MCLKLNIINRAITNWSHRVLLTDSEDGPSDRACRWLDCCKILHTLYQQKWVPDSDFRTGQPIVRCMAGAAPHERVDVEENSSHATYTHIPDSTLCTPHTAYIKLHQNQHNPHGPGCGEAGCGEAVGYLGEIISGQNWMTDYNNNDWGDANSRFLGLVGGTMIRPKRNKDCAINIIRQKRETYSIHAKVYKNIKKMKHTRRPCKIINLKVQNRQ